jgi:hypothetical protein
VDRVPLPPGTEVVPGNHIIHVGMYFPDPEPIRADDFYEIDRLHEMVRHCGYVSADFVPPVSASVSVLVEHSTRGALLRSTEILDIVAAWRTDFQIVNVKIVPFWPETPEGELVPPIIPIS